MENHEDKISILQRISILKNHIRGCEWEIEHREDKIEDIKYDIDCFRKNSQSYEKEIAELEKQLPLATLSRESKNAMGACLNAENQVMK